MPTASSRAGATLYWLVRYDTTASARCCDRIRLASFEPTLSVCPSIRKRKFASSLEASALPRLSRDALAAGVRSAEPVGKLTVRLIEGPVSGLAASSRVCGATCVACEPED